MSRTKTHISVLSHHRNLAMETRSFSSVTDRKQHVSKLASIAKATFPEPGTVKLERQ